MGAFVGSGGAVGTGAEVSSGVEVALTGAGVARFPFLLFGVSASTGAVTGASVTESEIVGDGESGALVGGLVIRFTGMIAMPPLNALGPFSDLVPKYTPRPTAVPAASTKTTATIPSVRLFLLKARSSEDRVVAGELILLFL